MLGSAIGPYRIRRLLADDRSGEVYLANDERLDRLVTLRVAPAFLATARRATQISHPAVSSIQELGEEDGRPLW